MQSAPFPNGGLDMPSRTTWSIMAPTLAISGLLLLVGMGGAWYMHRASLKVSASLDENLATAQSAEELVVAIRELRLSLDRFVDTDDVVHLDAAEQSLTNIETELDRSRSGETSDAYVDEVRYDDFREQFQQLRAQPSADQQRSAARLLLTFVNNELLSPAEKLLNHRQQLASETSRQNQVVARRIGLVLLLLGMCGAVAGLLIGYGIARSVHRSMVEISVPVRDIAGRLNEVVGPIKVSSNTDLFELDDSLRTLADKTAEVVRRLQESQQQSVRHEQLAAIGQLAAGLAHEVRNPLMSVKLIVQTAAERANGSLNKRDVEVIEGEITRLEKLLQTFLDFARPPQPNEQAVDIGQLVERTLEVVRPRADQQNVQLIFAESEKPLWVEADENQMRQVMLNVLLNALDVLPGGGNIWLDVRADKLPACQLPPNHRSLALQRRASNAAQNSALESQSSNAQVENLPHVVIRVEDDGPGLAAEVADRAFEPFVSTKDTGIGLGLSICCQIVESHDGRITARNRKEGGAEFTILLPLLQHATSEIDFVDAAETSPVSADV